MSADTYDTYEEKIIESLKERLEYKEMVKLLNGGIYCRECNIKCCSKCGEKEGYYNFKKGPFNNKIFVNKEIVKEIKDRYWVNDEKGFLTESGCNIPRPLRSWECLITLCKRKLLAPKAMEFLSKFNRQEDKWLFKCIRDRIFSIPDRSKSILRKVSKEIVKKHHKNMDMKEVKELAQKAES